MSKKVNVAMVGLGFGAEFIPIYQRHPNANVVAICRRNEKDLNEVGDRFGIAKRYQDFDKVLEDPEVDFVHINSPIPDHAWMSMRALQAGKHVMCTVPMATTIEDCDKICQLVADTGKKYMMAETLSTVASFCSSRICMSEANWARSVHVGKPSTRHGWLARVLGTHDSDALCNPRCVPCFGIGQRTS